VGIVAYAEEVVRSFAKIRDAYSGSIKVIHGFSVATRGISDESLIRSLREIDTWLTDIDKKHLHTLPVTAKHFLSKLYTKQDCIAPRATDTHSHPYKMPHSLHSLEKVAFTSPGWEDLATSLPPLQEEDEKGLLIVLLTELNEKFAMQLALTPSTERSCQNDTGFMDESSMTIILAGSSHLARSIDHFNDDSDTILDATVPGFRLSPESTSEMAKDLAKLVAGKVSSNTVVLIQVLDNAVYFCSSQYGEMALPKRGADGKYHVIGDLKTVKKSHFKELFSL